MTLGEFSILTLVAGAVAGILYYGRACYANGVYDAMLEHDEPGHPGAKRARRIMNQQPTTHQERVIKEKSVVDRNLAKLMTFRASAKFRDVEPEEQLLLGLQCSDMSRYSATLGKRIALHARNHL